MSRVSEEYKKWVEEKPDVDFDTLSNEDEFADRLACDGTLAEGQCCCYFDRRNSVGRFSLIQLGT